MKLPDSYAGAWSFQAQETSLWIWNRHFFFCSVGTLGEVMERIKVEKWAPMQSLVCRVCISPYAHSWCVWISKSTLNTIEYRHGGLGGLALWMRSWQIEGQSVRWLGGFWSLGLLFMGSYKCPSAALEPSWHTPGIILPKEEIGILHFTPYYSTVARGRGLYAYLKLQHTLSKQIIKGVPFSSILDLADATCWSWGVGLPLTPSH